MIKFYICTIKNTCEWFLTTDEDEARATDQSYLLASINDLHDWESISGVHYVDIIIQVQEGFCKWFELEFLNDYDEIEVECGYELINEYIVITNPAA